MRKIAFKLALLAGDPHPHGSIVQSIYDSSLSYYLLRDEYRARRRVLSEQGFVVIAQDDWGEIGAHPVVDAVLHSLKNKTFYAVKFYFNGFYPVRAYCKPITHKKALTIRNDGWWLCVDKAHAVNECIKQGVEPTKIKWK